MANFSAVKSTTLSELMPNASSLTTLDTAVSNAIISAVKFYQPYKFSFNNEKIEFNFIPNVDEYSITSTFISMYVLFVNDANKRIRMHKRNLSWIKRRNTDDNFIGTPRYFSPLLKNKIAISPFPSSTATATAFFHSRLSDLMGGGNLENDWLNEGQDLIKTRAKIIVAENVIRDYGYATNLRVQEAEIFHNLRMEYETQFDSFYIPNYFYEHDYYGE